VAVSLHFELAARGHNLTSIHLSPEVRDLLRNNEPAATCGRVPV